MSEEKPGTPKNSAPESPAPPDSGASSRPGAPSSGTSAAGSSAGAEMTREEKIAAAKAKAEALKAQRSAAAGGAPAAPGAAGTAQQPAAAGATPGAAAATPVSPAAAKPAPPQPGLATSENPGGQPAAAPQNPAIKALGTITQSVELTCAATEDQNIRKILGGLGAYKNPLRGVWQLDYRYYAEALKRLQTAGYKVEGADYLGRPLERWTPETRGWTRLS